MYLRRWDMKLDAEIRANPRMRMATQRLSLNRIFGFNHRRLLFFDFLLLAPRLFLLVRLEFIFQLLQLLVIIGRSQFDSFRRPFYCFIKIARFRITGSKRAQNMRGLKIGQLAGLPPESNRFFTVTERVIRRGCKQPARLLSKLDLSSVSSFIYFNAFL